MTTMTTTRRALDFEARPHPGRRTRSERESILDRSRFRLELHRSHGRGHLDRRRRLARLGRRAVRAVRARPGDGRAALRPGDLRRTEGVSASRRIGLAVPAREERGALRSVRSLGWRCPCSREADFLGSIEALVAADVGWVPEGGEKSLYLRPFMFASEAFLGVRPAQRVTYCCIASPAGRLLRLGHAPGTDLDHDHLHPRGPRRHRARRSAAGTTPPVSSRSRRRPTTAAIRSCSPTPRIGRGWRSSVG